MLKRSFLLLTVIGFTGCSTMTPQSTTSTPSKPNTVEKKQTQTVDTPTSVIITPYDVEEIKRKSIEDQTTDTQDQPTTPEKPKSETVLTPVIIPQKPTAPIPVRTTNKPSTKAQPPAFRNLIQNAQRAYARGDWNATERYALQAQRISPQAAETFMYLSMVANQKGQYANAESLARRGLSYAGNNSSKKQLWQVILTSAQQQHNAPLVQQAQQALAGL